MTAASLLPASSTDFERALEAATHPPADISSAITAVHGLKYRRPIADGFSQFLLHEYGLGNIAGYFNSEEQAIDQGRAWQRIRGTPLAASTALSWIGYNAPQILDQNAKRRRWHLYQIAMGAVPGDDEVGRLTDAEFLAGLSDRARSFFWRGFHDYDVRGLTLGKHKWGRSIVGDSSGVRIGGKTKWSHGKATSVAITATASERNALRVNFTTGQVVTWNSGLSWNAPGLTWSGISNAAKVKAWAMLQKAAFVAFYDAAGIVIGYARVVMAPTDATPAGNTNNATIRYVVRTGFGNGDGKVAAKAALVFGCEAVGVPVATQWLEPAQAAFPAGQIKVGDATAAISFQKTVRQLVTINLTI